MFAPEWEAGCKSCSFWADNFNGIVAHLNHRDVTMIAISRAPLAKLTGYARRLGWSFEWVSSFGERLRGRRGGERLRGRRRASHSLRRLRGGHSGHCGGRRGRRTCSGRLCGHRRSRHRLRLLPAHRRRSSSSGSLLWARRRSRRRFRLLPGHRSSSGSLLRGRSGVGVCRLRAR